MIHISMYFGTFFAWLVILFYVVVHKFLVFDIILSSILCECWPTFHRIIETIRSSIPEKLLMTNLSWWMDILYVLRCVYYQRITSVQIVITISVCTLIEKLYRHVNNFPRKLTSTHSQPIDFIFDISFIVLKAYTS